MLNDCLKIPAKVTIFIALGQTEIPLYLPEYPLRYCHDPIAIWNEKRFLPGFAGLSSNLPSV
jgi:hypothetical protein